VSLHLYVTPSDVEAGASMEALMDGLAARARTWWRTPVQVCLSGALARPFVFGPVAGLKGWREAHEAAAAAAPTACGLQGPCAAALEADPSAGPALAIAVELSVLDSIHAAAGARRLRIASIRPAWARATESRGQGAAAGDSMLCCREPAALTVMASRAGNWTFAATYAPAPSAKEQERLLRRLQASLGIGAEHMMLNELVAKGKDAPPVVCWSGLRAELPA
jgi:hypothetical protein